MTASPTPARWSELAHPAVAARAGLVLLGIWLNAADSLVTVTIMPSVARDLGGFAWFGWAVAVYLLGSILAAASAGQLSERLGLKPAMVAAALAYAVGCALSGAAPHIGLFLVGRLIQGLGAGWIVGFCYVAIGVMFPERLWARMFGAGAAVWGVASFLGPLVGGAFAQSGHWRGAFWLFSAQGALFALAAPLLLRGLSPPEADGRRPLAWRTLCVLTAAIGAIAAADIARGAAEALSLLTLGLALLLLGAVVNAWPGEALLPRDAARPSTVAGAGYAMIFSFSAAAAVYSVYGAAILQTAYHLSPLAAGFAIASEAAGWTLTALAVSSQPERRHGALIVAGGVAIVAGVASLALLAGRAGVWSLVFGGAVMGAGFGLAWSVSARRILTALPPRDLALGAAATPTLQMLGGAVGAAAAGAVANLLGLAHHFTASRALAQAPWLFGAFVPVAGLGLMAAVRLAAPVRPPPLPPPPR